MEHFLAIVNIPEVRAEASMHYLLQFLSGKGIPLSKLRGLGFDGANTISGRKSGVQDSYASSCSKCSVCSLLLSQQQLAAVHD